MHGTRAQGHHAGTAGHVARTLHAQLHREPHPGQRGAQRVLEVVGRGREVLEHSAGDAGLDRSIREGQQGQQPQGKHGGGPGRADVPRVAALAGRASRVEHELGRPHAQAFRPPAAELGAGGDGGEVLGPQAGLGPARPGVGEVQRLAEQRGEGHGVTDDGAAARVLRPVNLDHARASLAPGGARTSGPPAAPPPPARPAPRTGGWPRAPRTGPSRRSGARRPCG